MSKKLKVGLACLLSAVAISLLWWRLSPSPSLREVALHTIDALKQSDGERALRYVSPEERRLLNLSGDKISGILADVHLAVERGSPVGELQVQEYPDAGIVAANQSLHTAAGKQLELSVFVVMTDSGPMVKSFVYSLLMYGASGAFPLEKSQRQGLPKLLVLREELPTLSRIFMHHGVDGLIMDKAGDSKLFKWREFEAYLDAQIKVLSAKQSVDSAKAQVSH